MIPARPFFLIRHGETVMNALKRCCGGGVDTTLNKDGRAQAESAARVLQSLPEKPTLIINSGMSRTRETTEIVNQFTNLPVLEDNELREHMMGEWENAPWEDIMPHLRAGTKPAGGESSGEYAARVCEALTRNLNKHPLERILFVAHGGTFHSFMRIHGMGRHIFIPNATLHRFAPEPAHEKMPWRVDMIRWTQGGPHTAPAPICPSQPEPDIETR